MQGSIYCRKCGLFEICKTSEIRICFEVLTTIMEIYKFPMLQCSLQGCDWAFTTGYKLKRHEESHQKRKDYIVSIKLKQISIH